MSRNVVGIVKSGHVVLEKYVNRLMTGNIYVEDRENGRVIFKLIFWEITYEGVW